MGQFDNLVQEETKKVENSCTDALRKLLTDKYQSGFSI
jgi:hypothetical protein